MSIFYPFVGKKLNAENNVQKPHNKTLALRLTSFFISIEYHIFTIRTNAPLKRENKMPVLSISRLSWLCLWMAFTFATSLPQKAIAQFTNVSDLLDITTTVPTTYNGNGLSFYDFNGDGWDDITIARGNTDPVFLVNIDGSFEPAAFEIPNESGHQINMILWADYDGDDDVDLLITKWEGPVELWQNDGAFNFENVAEAAGLNTGNFRHLGAAYADFDHDGDLDLHIGKFYHPSFFSGPDFAGAFYLNNGDGTFTDQTVEVGVFVNPRPIFQPVFLDFNNDGWEDLYLITDRVFSENALFKNNGDGTFENVSEGSGANIMIDSMTGTVGDFENDGDLDIYITNSPPDGSKFLENNGDETFTEGAAAFGVNMTQIGWGSLWIDYDNDSWQDLFVSSTEGTQVFPGNFFYRNNAGINFTNMAEELGLRDEITETYVCAKADINLDGYFDILLNNAEGYLPKLYENDGGENHYLSVSLRGVTSNRDGTGAWIKCYAAGSSYVRWTLCGENLIGQDANRYIFGLGDNQTVDSLVVEWNMGTRDVYYELNADQHLLVTEGTAAYTDLAVQSSASYLCPDSSLTLSIGLFDEYLWSTGETTAEIAVTEPGQYAVAVRVPGGAWVETDSISITAADELFYSADITQENCFESADGSISLNIGSANTTLLWSNGSDLETIENLAPGAYQVEITDSFGCKYTETYQIEAATALNLIASTTDALCYGDSTGQANVVLFGGAPPYELDWSWADPMALPAGFIPLTVSDANGCDSIFQIFIDSPDSLSIEIATTNAQGSETGSANAAISGGTPPYEILWSEGTSEGTQVTGLPAGEYSLEVIDANGCRAEVVFQIEQVLGTSSQFDAGNLYLAPNPFGGGSLKIMGLEQNLTANISFYDLLGHLCLYYPNQDTSVSLNPISLKKGTYIVVIETHKSIETVHLVII